MRFALACVFMDALGIGLIIPVLPKLIGTLAADRTLQTQWYAAIMVSYGLMQFFFAPLLGALSDRIGRRPVLLTGIAGLALMMSIPAWTDSLLFILLSRFAGGAMSSNMVVAQAYIADVTPTEKRISSFGKIGAIFGIAFVLGPAVGGLLGDFSPRLPFICASVICAINFLFGLFIMPESLVSPVRTKPDWKRLNPFSALITLAGNRTVRPLMLICLLFTLAQSIVQCTWALYTEYRFNWTPSDIGLSIFALGLSITLTQGGLLPSLSSRLNHRQLILFGLTIGIAALTVLGLSPWSPLALICFCAFSFAGIVGPTIQGTVSAACSADEQGISMGALSSLNSFTGAVSPVIGTPLLVLTSSAPADSAAAGAPYYLTALLLVTAFFTAWRTVR